MHVSAKGIGWKKEVEKRTKGRIRVVYRADYFFLFLLFLLTKKSARPIPKRRADL